MARGPRIPETATVTVSAAVDGTVQRRGRGPGRRAPLDYEVKVDPRVMEVVNRIKRPGERVVIISESEVRLVNITEKRDNA